MGNNVSTQINTALKKRFNLVKWEKDEKNEICIIIDGTHTGVKGHGYKCVFNDVIQPDDKCYSNPKPLPEPLKPTKLCVNKDNLQKNCIIQCDTSKYTIGDNTLEGTLIQ